MPFPSHWAQAPAVTAHGAATSLPLRPRPAPHLAVCRLAQAHPQASAAALVIAASQVGLRALSLADRVPSQQTLHLHPLPAFLISLLRVLSWHSALRRALRPVRACLFPSLGFPLSEAGTFACMVTCTPQLPRADLAQSRSHQVRELKCAREAGGIHAGAAGSVALPGAQVMAWTVPDRTTLILCGGSVPACEGGGGCVRS